MTKIGLAGEQNDAYLHALRKEIEHWVQGERRGFLALLEDNRDWLAKAEVTANEVSLATVLDHLIGCVRQWGKPVLPPYDDGIKVEGSSPEACAAVKAHLDNPEVQKAVLAEAHHKAMYGDYPTPEEIKKGATLALNKPPSPKVYGKSHDELGRPVRNWLKNALKDAQAEMLKQTGMPITKVYTAEGTFDVKDGCLLDGEWHDGPAKAGPEVGYPSPDEVSEAVDRLTADVRDNEGTVEGDPGWVRDLCDAAEQEERANGEQTCNCGPEDACDLCCRSGDADCFSDAEPVNPRAAYNQLPHPMLCPKCSNLVARTDGANVLVVDAPDGFQPFDPTEGPITLSCPCGHSWRWQA
jgi:hypothetical protein